MTRNGYRVKRDRRFARAMPTDGTWEPRCRKFRFDTRSEARAHLVAYQATDISHHKRAYRCETCDGWHLTSMAQPPDRR